MRLADESVVAEVHLALRELIRDPSCFPAIEKQLNERMRAATKPSRNASRIRIGIPLPRVFRR